MIELRKVNDNNLWGIVDLSVHPEQEAFVASNAQSILEAYVTMTAGDVALPFGLYHGDTLVGFVLFASFFSSINQKKTSPESGDQSYYVNFLVLKSSLSYLPLRQTD